MNRREFLRRMAIAAGAAAGTQLAGPWRAFAQEADHAGHAHDVAAPSSAPRGPVPGVSDTEIRIGMSSPITGPLAFIGIETYRAVQAVFDEVNSLGGIHGRTLRLIALDDAYDANRTLQNTIRLVQQEDVFSLISYLGTSTTSATLPFLKNEEPNGLVLIGVFSGAVTLRRPPYSNQIFHIRPSYKQEAEALTSQFWDLGHQRIGTFYQLDGFGRTGVDGIRDVLAARGGRLTAETTYRPGAGTEADFRPQIEILRDAGVNGVVCTANPGEFAHFVTQVRDAGWNVPIANVSDGVDAIGILRDREAQRGRRYTDRLLVTSITPLTSDTSLDGVRLYRDLVDKWNPAPHPDYEGSYQQGDYLVLGLESFLNARVLASALRSAGPGLTRAGFVRALESTRNLDLGIGKTLSYGPNDREGLDDTFYVTVRDGAWAPVTDWSAL